MPVKPHITPIDGDSKPKKYTLEENFNRRKLNEARISKMGAFQFFCWLLEKPKPDESETFINYCFKFLALNRDDQSYIVAAREDKVYWRGDEISFFRTVYDNTMQWRAMSEDDKDNSKGSILARWKLVSARESRNL